MIIRRHQIIAGHAAPIIRRLLRQTGSSGVNQAFVEKGLGCSAEEATRLISSLQEQGYISIRNHDKNRWLYERTSEGNRLAEATLRPVSRSTADMMLRGFVQRISKVNSNPRFLYAITAAVVFGSAISEVDELGDVDVAIRLERKTADWETHVRLTYERVWQARRKGKRFRNITEQVFWPAIEIRNFLRSGTRQLSIHELDELSRLPEVNYRILFGDRQALAELLPNANMVA
jgi:DNA-binding MarR family transcriptional regulator